jgi:hypothetical protein
MQSTYPRRVVTPSVSTPTDEWILACTECEFNGAAAEERLAERLADTHRSASNHAMVVRPVEGALTG